MSHSRISALLLAMSGLPAAMHAQLTAGTQPVASQIVCPITEVQWGIGQSLPDPWWSEPKTTTTGFSLGLLVGPSTGPYTTSAMGKEMLACRWADYGKTSYGPWPTGIQLGQAQPNTHIYMMRPATDTPPETWTCPATVQVRVLTSLPAPWLGTTYQWSLSGKQQALAGGGPANMCQYSGMIPNEILYPIQTTAQAGMTGLVSNPPPAIDQLAQALLLTKAQLTAIPAKRSTSCPTTVRFEGRIGANTAGAVKYRTELNGQMSPQQTLTFTSAGEKVVKFQTQVGPDQQQSAGLSLATPHPSNVVKGEARIVMESPQNIKESNLAKYEITCTPLAPAGNLAQAAAAQGGTAPTLAAPASPPTGAPAIASVPERTGARPARAAAAAPPGTVIAPSQSRVVILRTQRVPVRVADGRTGWVQFDLAGPVEGRPTGSMTLALGRAAGSLATTMFQVSGGTGKWQQTDYHFQLEGAARDAGSASSRRFTSRLTIAGGKRTGTPSPGGVQHEDTWTVQHLADGDVLVIDDLMCQWSGTVIHCNSRPR